MFGIAWDEHDLKCTEGVQNRFRLFCPIDLQLEGKEVTELAWQSSIRSYLQKIKKLFIDVFK